jgi:hypothetical protein
LWLTFVVEFLLDFGQLLAIGLDLLLHLHLLGRLVLRVGGGGAGRGAKKEESGRGKEKREQKKETKKGRSGEKK